MTKKIIIVGVAITIIALLIVKGLAFLRKAEVNTVDPQASPDIESSKRDGLFLKEYEINGSTGDLFQIKEAWVEHTWKNGYEDNIVKVKKTSGAQLVLRIVDFSDSTLRNDRYLLDWEMKDSANGFFGKANGVYRKILRSSSLPDSFNIVLGRVRNNVSQDEIGRLTLNEKQE